MSSSFKIDRNAVFTKNQKWRYLLCTGRVQPWQLLIAFYFDTYQLLSRKHPVTGLPVTEFGYWMRIGVVMKPLAGKGLRKMIGERMEKTHDAITEDGSSLKKYQKIIVGSSSLIKLIYYEWCQLLCICPGALGMVLRKMFWPRLFAACGKGVMFGNNVVLRHPSRIHLGDRVVISEQCILDGRSDAKSATIVLGDDVILSNQVMLSCKEGSIQIARKTGINAGTIIQSTNDCPVSIGDNCIIGQRCFIVGGGSYNIDRLDIPIKEQGIRRDGGVRLEADVWLGGNVTVLGGVIMGSGSVAAAGAVVTRSVAERSICMGVPARVVAVRGQNDLSPRS